MDITNTVLLTSIAVDDFELLIENLLRKIIKEEFAPLRRQFEDRLISRKEAAKALGVTLATLHNMKKRGELMPLSWLRSRRT